MSGETTVVTPKQIADQAQRNATVLTLATISYLPDHEFAVDEGVRV